MLIAQRPTLSEEAVDDFRSRFVIEPLEPGFGYTLGNSLRRTLLSSIPGAAVTSIKIDGVLHEFTTIPGVKEDVVEVRPRSKSVGRIVEAAAYSSGRAIPGWLRLEAGELRISVDREPARDDMDVPVQEQMIVELYSK